MAKFEFILIFSAIVGFGGICGAVKLALYVIEKKRRWEKEDGEV